MKKISIVLFIIILISSCSRELVKNPEQSMRLSSIPNVEDKLPTNQFFNTLKDHISNIENNSKISNEMIFGNKKVLKSNYIASLKKLLDQKENPNWVEYIRDNFDFYEVYGDKEWGEVLTTGYYEPRVKGSKSPTSEYSEPLYKKPDDIFRIDLKPFKSRNLLETNPNGLMARFENKKIVPYYDRKEIVTDRKLKGKKLEIAYLNPIDAFFIEIQGSGVVYFEDGSEIRVGYSEQNGYPYTAIGKYLKNVIPIEKMSMQRIKAHLQKLPANEQQEILNKNQSYVFFQELKTKAQTYLGIEVSDGRTIATDRSVFPKGALCFLDVEENKFDDNNIDPISTVRTPRFVFDQDIGGAIKGTGHVDLYFGSGDEAALKAGAMKNISKLYYLVPKV